ncbi:hypothetical protein BDZ97DRAFT_1951033 [Flammula alnicola]|nr:hypothetical protein BDZ97DRAFT_1951033 [Flammula alnicola]
MPLLHENVEEENQSKTVTVDTVIFDNGKITGVGIYYDEDDEQNQAIRLPNRFKQTAQTGELSAIKIASENLTNVGELCVNINSRMTIDSLLKRRAKMEDQGYVGVQNKELIQATVASMRKRRKRTKLKLVRNKQKDARAQEADTLADEGALKHTCDEIDLAIDQTMKLTGATLSKMTQSLAYKMIRERKMLKYTKRNRTKVNIKATQSAAKAAFGVDIAEEKIWRSIRNKDLSRNIRYFMWMVTHDAYMIGTQWLRPTLSAEMQERSKCRHCDDAIETMEHILTECKASGQEEVWQLVKNLWEMKSDTPWPELSLGTILASASAKFPLQGEARLYRVMVPEAAHLIWKMRCTRVIQNENEATTEVEANRKLLKSINARLEMDCKMTNPKYGKKALRKDIVLDTWKGTLKNEEALPQDWTRESGVLVGIEPQENDGRGRDR